MTDRPDMPEPISLPPSGGAVVPLGAQRLRGDASAHAAFISQLIAERYHLMPQRERRRAPMPLAVSSYAETMRRVTRRVPPGHRTTIVA
ncbi:MAG: hypothetical protein ACTHOR_13435 [Devosia sp.]